MGVASGERRLYPRADKRRLGCRGADVVLLDDAITTRVQRTGAPLSPEELRRVHAVKRCFGGRVVALREDG